MRCNDLGGLDASDPRPVQQTGGSLADECLAGEGDGEKVDNEDDNAGSHKLCERGLLKWFDIARQWILSTFSGDICISKWYICVAHNILIFLKFVLLPLFYLVPVDWIPPLHRQRSRILKENLRTHICNQHKKGKDSSLSFTKTRYKIVHYQNISDIWTDWLLLKRLCSNLPSFLSLHSSSRSHF